MAQDVRLEKIDLRPTWKSFDQNQFVDYRGEGVRYFSIDTGNGDLIVSGPANFSIFLNHQLLSTSSGTISLSLDSLSQRYGRPMLFGVYSKKEVTTTLHRLRAGIDPLVIRKSDDFKNFVIIISILLLMIITSLLYINPKLTMDYLNVVKFLSVQEREETLTAIRTTASINFVYYLFGSLALAFLLIALGHGAFITRFSWAGANSFVELLLNLLRLTLIIFVMLMSKLVGVSVLARMFHMREVASFQFFNSIRVIFIALALVSLLALAFFMVGVVQQQYYFRLLQVGFALVALSALLVLIKLLPKVPFRFSYLFSYLCASEIIPLMILIKVLFK